MIRLLDLLLPEAALVLAEFLDAVRGVRAGYDCEAVVIDDRLLAHEVQGEAGAFVVGVVSGGAMRHGVVEKQDAAGGQLDGDGL